MKQLVAAEYQTRRVTTGLDLPSALEGRAQSSS